jgi:hypothetical protein
MAQVNTPVQLWRPAGCRRPEVAYGQRAVEMQANAARAVARQARTAPEIRDRLFIGIHAYLDECRDSDYLRIVIREAPAALGQARFEAIEQAYPMALFAATLQALQDGGEINFPHIGFVTRAVDAIVCKMALLMDVVDDQAALRANGDVVIAKLLRLESLTGVPHKCTHAADVRTASRGSSGYEGL